MKRNPLGSTGLEVSIVGFGAMHLNDDRVSEAEAGRLLNAVLDLGVNLVDTARGYGLSEERIGRHLSWRRRDFLLSTKVGYGIPGFEDWTYDNTVRLGPFALSLSKCPRGFDRLSPNGLIPKRTVLGLNGTGPRPGPATPGRRRAGDDLTG